MRINKKVFIGIVIIVIVLIIWVVLKGNSSKVQGTPKIIHPHYGAIQTVINTTATILPKNRLEIKAPVNGRVEKVLVQEGDMVKAGQIIAWMSSTDRAALLDSARGQGDKEYQYWQDVYKPIPLLAPINAQVIVAITQPGQTVTTTDAVLVLSDRLIVRAQVDETDIGRVKLNQDALISLDAYADTKIKATVDHIYYESTTINNVTIYNVDLLPQEIPVFFRSGMNANVDFIIERKDHVLLIPLTAVNKKEERSFVWIEGANKSKPMMKDVKTGISDERNVEVLSGLQEEDEIIVKTKKFTLDKFKSGSNPFMASRPSGSGGRSSGSR